MRPKSDPKSRLNTIKDLRTAPAVKSYATGGANQYALERRENAAAKLLVSDRPSGYLGSVGREAFATAASHLIISDSWNPDALSDLSRGLAFIELIARWHQCIGSSKHSDETHDADNSATVLKQSVWAAFIWAHLGDWDRARWMAEYLLGYFASGAVRVPSEETENDYRSLFVLLLQTLRDEAWPSTFSTTLGPYKELIEARHDPDRFAQALVATADLRMARQCGYAQVNDARSFGPYAPPPLMGSVEFVAMPAELWAIRALAQRLDGMSLNLDADHPWLRAGFAQAPSGPLPAVQDSLLEAARQRMEAVA